ncbi:hypothetical protein DNAM5_136 [Haloarcula californiae tailed virus 1]|uniref:Uncharacterized protein n=1 Tax=Haloarcula californiae tailed virus 1 TaxID=1273746 RepID=R4T894_9CAUD|nr:hypothetical protein M202_gp084 [Haloarcula californiae tailed virus 1]AGM11994.1 hypothetical protein DNAM5_136 [Haloarcula californiae tailed virus 1]
MSEDDEMIQENSVGEIQTATIDLADAVEEVEQALDTLGVDRRTSMPQDQNCLEYRIRDAHALLTGAKNQLADEAGEGYDDL